MYSGAIIDCDVHHNWVSTAVLASYLPARWREFLHLRDPGSPLSLMPSVGTYVGTHGHNRRLDSFPAAGGPPGSDYPMMKAQLLDRYSVERAILLYDIGTNVGVPNPYLATELARAANDWSIDRWLNLDPRIFGGVLLPTQQPAEAAREIRRVGHHPRMVTALMCWNGIGRAFGDPLYDPIYDAACEYDLTITIHVGNQGIVPAFAGGPPGSRVEVHTLLEQAAQHHLVSLLVHGVFEKFPTLRVLIAESGFAWVPWLVWKLDSINRIIQSENPSVKRLPSESVREHVRLTTQPFDWSPRSQSLESLLSAFDGFDDLLCFSSDYAHWDADDPTYVARKLPAAWQPKVFFENADALYRWPSANDEPLHELAAT